MHAFSRIIKKRKNCINCRSKKTVDSLKEEISNEETLKFPYFSKKFIQECDASNNGVGEVLYQQQGVLGHFSKKLNEVERNFLIVKKEILAMVRALIHFKDIIQGYYIETFTVSKSCTFQKSRKLK